MPIKKITPKAMSALKDINYTGNIRELKNIIERLVILSPEKITDIEVLAYVSNAQSKGSTTQLFDKFDRFQEFKDHIESIFIADKLKKHAGLGPIDDKK